MQVERGSQARSEPRPVQVGSLQSDRKSHTVTVHGNALSGTRPPANPGPASAWGSASPLPLGRPLQRGTAERQESQRTELFPLLLAGVKMWGQWASVSAALQSSPFHSPRTPHPGREAWPMQPLLSIHTAVGFRKVLFSLIWSPFLNESPTSIHSHIVPSVLLGMRYGGTLGR